MKTKNRFLKLFRNGLFLMLMSFLLGCLGQSGTPTAVPIIQEEFKPNFVTSPLAEYVYEEGDQYVYEAGDQSISAQAVIIGRTEDIDFILNLVNRRRSAFEPDSAVLGEEFQEVSFQGYYIEEEIDNLGYSAVTENQGVFVDTTQPEIETALQNVQGAEAIVFWEAGNLNRDAQQIKLEVPPSCQLDAFEGADDYSQLEIRLVSFEAKSKEEANQFVPLINATAREQERQVYADQNRFLSDGVPYSIGGGPFGGLAEVEAVETDFPELIGQWAFQETAGLNLFRQEEENWVRTVDAKGSKNVVVAIFDTSPFGDTTGSIDDMPSIHGEPMSMKIHHPVAPNEFDSDGEFNKISNHGLFIASIIHAIAPNSEINLYRVLNDEGLGDLFWLLRGLSDFNNSMNDEYQYILNLSLTMLPQKDVQNTGNSGRFETLKTMLEVINCKDAHIIAAAGNTLLHDSGDPANFRGSAQLAPPPARFDDTVLSVMALNSFEEISCFSGYRGNFAAPGGDSFGIDSIDEWHTIFPSESGELEEYFDARRDTISRLCGVGVESGLCANFHLGSDLRYTYLKEKFCIIGLTYQENEENGKYEYALSYGVGTSYATPFVVGTAALILGNCDPETKIEPEALRSYLIGKSADPDNPKLNFHEIMDSCPSG